MFDNSKRFDIYQQLNLELLEQISLRKQKTQHRREKDGISQDESKHEKLIELQNAQLSTALVEARSTLRTPLMRTNRYVSGRQRIKAIEMIVPHVTFLEKFCVDMGKHEEADRFDQLYRWLMDKLHRHYQQKKDPRFNMRFLIHEEIIFTRESQDNVKTLFSSDDDAPLDDTYLRSNVPEMSFFDPNDIPAPAS